MAKLTLLDMTQEILSNLSSDEVNSIGDTTESMQVANIIKQKYRDITARSNNPEHSQLIKLTPSNDYLKPVLMILPDGVSYVEWLKYYEETSTGEDNYRYVTQLPIAQYLDMVNSYNPLESNVYSFTFTDGSTDFDLRYKNDAQPTYFTLIGNRYLIFDSYDATVDSTLQNSKTMCFGRITPSFQMEDDFVPDLSDDQFSLLVNEAKALAFYELKQQPHLKAEQEIKRQWSSFQKNKHAGVRPTDFERLPDFGRRGAINIVNRWWNGPKL